jgi:hypothetical protein
MQTTSASILEQQREITVQRVRASAKQLSPKEQEKVTMTTVRGKEGEKKSVGLVEGWAQRIRSREQGLVMEKRSTQDYDIARRSGPR